MPKCPSPCTGSCPGYCVCVILGSNHKCKDVGNYKELMATLDDADELRIWSDHPLVKQLRSEIDSGASLKLQVVAGEEAILSLTKR